MWILRQQVSFRRAFTPVGISLFVLGLGLSCGTGSSPAAPDSSAKSTPLPEATVAPVPTTTATPVLTVTPPAVAGSVVASPTSPAAVGLPSISELVDKIKPSVVSITTEKISQGLFFSFKDEGAGTGIVLRPNGYILTNFHVIQNARDIKVHLSTGESYDGTVVGGDIVTDLAIVKIDADQLPTPPFGDSEKLRVGDWVVALGNALALKGGPTVTIGIVSATGRTVFTDRGWQYDLIQTDAAINEGNSGGPLVNLNGEIIGINSVAVARAVGIGFAVSSSTARPIIDSLIESGRVARPLIGLVGNDLTPAIANQLNLPLREGVIVTQMSREGPAYKAGIRLGDVIIKIDEIPTPDVAHFLGLLWSYGVGDKIRVEYFSNNQSRTTIIELAERTG